MGFEAFGGDKSGGVGRFKFKILIDRVGFTVNSKSGSRRGDGGGEGGGVNKMKNKLGNDKNKKSGEENNGADEDNFSLFGVLHSSPYKWR